MVMPIITNTTERPLFVAARLLHPGMSCECDAHDIPKCLIPAIPLAAEASAAEDAATADTVAADSVVTAEDQLVAAVSKSKK